MGLLYSLNIPVNIVFDYSCRIPCYDYIRFLYRFRDKCRWTDHNIVGDFHTFENRGTMAYPYMIADKHILWGVDTSSWSFVKNRMWVSGSDIDVGRKQTIILNFQDSSFNDTHMNLTAHFIIIADNNLWIIVFQPENWIYEQVIGANCNFAVASVYQYITVSQRVTPQKKLWRGCHVRESWCCNL